jgi:hypothetical protein
MKVAIFTLPTIICIKYYGKIREWGRSGIVLAQAYPTGDIPGKRQLHSSGILAAHSHRRAVPRVGLRESISVELKNQTVQKLFNKIFLPTIINKHAHF